MNYQINEGISIGSQSSVVINQAVVDDLGDVSGNSENGIVEIGTKPARPSWKVPEIGETFIKLKWFDNSEPDLLGYKVSLQTSSGGILDSTELLKSATSYGINNLEGANRYTAVLSAVNDLMEESDSVYLNMETFIGTQTTGQDALFLLSEEWNPEGKERNLKGIELLLPQSSDINNDGIINLEDLVTIISTLE